MDRAYGGIVVDADGRILLRQPTGQFHGYAWTFPKGRPEPWETPEEAALREVKEETGYSAEIRRKLPGSFKRGTSMTKFFLMSPVGTPADFNSQETSAIMWATIDEAAKLIRMTKNRRGLARDLSVLVAVQLALKEIELEGDALVEKEEMTTLAPRASSSATMDCLAGDAVLIAPVSKQIPWYQGILQGILRFWGSETRFSAKKPLRCSDFSSNSLHKLTGKIFRRAGNF